MDNAGKNIYEITVGVSHLETGVCDSASWLVAEELKSAEMKSGFAVCWLWHEILFGKVGDGCLVFPPSKAPDLDRDLREMRLFNESRELYLYRAEKGFRFRRRIDGGEERAEYIDARQVLWGTEGDVREGWTTLSEKRGIRLTVPIQAVGVDTGRRVVLATRNYIAETDIGQAGITDCRYVDLVFKGE